MATDPASKLAEAWGITRREAKAILFRHVYGKGANLDEVVDRLIAEAEAT